MNKVYKVRATDGTTTTFRDVGEVQDVASGGLIIWSPTGSRMRTYGPCGYTWYERVYETERRS